MSTLTQQLHLAVCRHAPSVSDFHVSVVTAAVGPPSAPVNPERGCLHLDTWPTENMQRPESHRGRLCGQTPAPAVPATQPRLETQKGSFRQTPESPGWPESPSRAGRPRLPPPPPRRRAPRSGGVCFLTGAGGEFGPETGTAPLFTSLVGQESRETRRALMHESVLLSHIFERVSR